MTFLRGFPHFEKSFILIFNGLKTGNDLKSNTLLLILDPEFARRTSRKRSRYKTGSSIKSQVLDLKTLPTFSPLKISVNVVDNLIQSIKGLIDCTHQLQRRWNVLGFENALSAVKIIKDQIQCRSHSLLKVSPYGVWQFRRTHSHFLVKCTVGKSFYCKKCLSSKLESLLTFYRSLLWLVLWQLWILLHVK